MDAISNIGEIKMETNKLHQNQDGKGSNLEGFVLSSLLTSYPDNSFRENLEELLKSEGLLLPEALRIEVEELAANEKLIDEIRSEYISIFDHSKSLNPLYETEYGRERAMFKGNELADIAGFYRAFGFEIDSENGHEMLDHVSVELEFYSILKMKHLYLAEINDFEGCEIVFDGMKKFMECHLGRFVPAILEREGVKNSGFYNKVFVWINDLIEQECERINIKPEKVKWISSQVETGDVCCGGTVSISNN